MKTKRDVNGVATTVRASISFPTDIYESLESLAREKKVSLAWVVRDAAEKYVASQCGLQEQKMDRKTMQVRTA
jgi:metal-responsive CopG/Arc/MetJ family transcriptional regulator